MAAVPGCSDSEPAPGPGGVDGAVYGIAVDASTPDAGPVYGIAVDASTSDANDPDAAGVPLYGVAPESDEPQ